MADWTGARSKRDRLQAELAKGGEPVAIQTPATEQSAADIKAVLA